MGRLCLLKISDKISYVCRDIEDSVTLGILDNCSNELHKLLNLNNFENINNTNVINGLIYDLCMNSSFDNRIMFFR